MQNLVREWTQSQMELPPGENGSSVGSPRRLGIPAGLRQTLTYDVV